MDYYLSNDDVEQIVGHKINTIIYDQMDKVKNIDDLFINDCCLILYNWGMQNNTILGHWCCLRRNKIGNKTIINFFDSYGKFIDDQLYKIPIKHIPNLSKLLYKFSIRKNCYVEFNNRHLQKLDDKVATCGRWCGLFMKYKDVSIDDFGDIFLAYKKIIKPDLLVTLLTV